MVLHCLAALLAVNIKLDLGECHKMSYTTYMSANSGSTFQDLRASLGKGGEPGPEEAEFEIHPQNKCY